MQIVFSDHSLARIKERKITKLQVYATIRNPQQKDTSYRERLVYKRKFRSKILEVITKKEGDTIVVISAYMVK